MLVDDAVVLLHLLTMLLFCWSCWELDTRRATRRRRGGGGGGGGIGRGGGEEEEE